MLLPAITWQRTFYRCINQLLIMWFDDTGYVLGATVARIYIYIYIYIYMYIYISVYRNTTKMHKKMETDRAQPLNSF